MTEESIYGYRQHVLTFRLNSISDGLSPGDAVVWTDGVGGTGVRRAADSECPIGRVQSITTHVDREPILVDRTARRSDPVVLYYDVEVVEEPTRLETARFRMQRDENRCCTDLAIRWEQDSGEPYEVSSRIDDRAMVDDPAWLLIAAGRLVGRHDVPEWIRGIGSDFAAVLFHRAPLQVANHHRGIEATTETGITLMVGQGQAWETFCRAPDELMPAYAFNFPGLGQLGRADRVAAEQVANFGVAFGGFSPKRFDPEARARARDTLQVVLTPEQWTQYNERGSIDVVGNVTGRCYEVVRGSAFHDGSSYCWDGMYGYCWEDRTIAVRALIQHNEKMFLETTQTYSTSYRRSKPLSDHLRLDK